MRSLYDRRHRAERGAFVVEGPQAAASAVTHGQVHELYVTDDAALSHSGLVEQARNGGARVTVMTEAVGRAMSQTQAPQGVIAVCSLVTRSWMGLPCSDHPSTPRVLVVLDRISDPGNAGTIIRTADAAGACAVVFTPGSVDPHNDKCVRATAGSIFHLPLFTDVTVEQIIAEARALGVTTLAADGRGELVLGSPQAHEIISGDVVWVFGNEAHGVPSQVLVGVDARVSIPMRGSAESLNLAAAASICLYASAMR